MNENNLLEFRSPYHVTLPVFEGPLDLLLHLIKENNVDIFNIPIAKITDQYLSYVDALQTLNLDVAGEFLLMAATLAHIKSKLLLPPDPTQEETEDEGQDPRADLVRRLLLYQKYKAAADQLSQRAQLDREVFVRIPLKEVVKDQPVEIAELSIFKLVHAFHKILDNLHLVESHDVGKEIFSVRECAKDIEFFLRQSGGKASFQELFVGYTDYQKVVASFLAVLAMIKRGVLRVYQSNDFGEILLATTDMFEKGEWSYDGSEFDEQQYHGPIDESFAGSEANPESAAPQTE